METDNKTKALDLSGKCRTLKSIQKIANELGQNSSLTRLDIGYNSIGSEGAKVIAEALCRNSSLTQLNLEYNNIGSEGAKVIAEALCRNSSLTQLDISLNNIGSEGAKVIAESLGRFSTENLPDGEPERSEGRRAKRVTLCRNSSLTQLNLWNNNIGSEEKNIIKALISNIMRVRTQTQLEKRSYILLGWLSQNSPIYLCDQFLLENILKFAKISTNINLVI